MNFRMGSFTGGGAPTQENFFELMTCEALFGHLTSWRAITIPLQLKWFPFFRQRDSLAITFP